MPINRFSPSTFASLRPYAVALGVTLAAGAGCASVPSDKTPAMPAVGPLVAPDGAPVVSQPLPDAWWRLYDDPVLDALVTQALTQNRDLAIAQAHLASAEAAVSTANAARLPGTLATLGGNEGKQTGDQTVASARRADTTTRWAWTPSFSLSYEVDLWGRVRHVIDAAHADADATQAARDAVRVEVVAATTSRYAQACSYGAQINIARQSVDIARQLADLTQQQRTLGLISDFDVARARGLLATAQAVVPALEGQHRAALAELAVLIGKPPSDIPAAVVQCDITPSLAQPFPVGDGAALLRRRPDLRQAERQLAAAQARVGIATAALYPSILLGSSIDLVSTKGSLASLGDRYAMSWGVGPLISWRFPNRAVSLATLAQSKADGQAALAAFEGRVLNALKETDQALGYYGTEWSRHHALQTAFDEDARALRLARLNYKAGALDFLDVLDADRTLIADRMSLAQSTAAVSADQIAVFKALGGGWRNVDVVPASASPKAP